MRPDTPSLAEPEPSARSRIDTAGLSVPAAETEGEWEELLLASFGPRHWNVGCG